MTDKEGIRATEEVDAGAQTHVEESLPQPQRIPVASHGTRGFSLQNVGSLMIPLPLDPDQLATAEILYLQNSFVTLSMADVLSITKNEYALFIYRDEYSQVCLTDEIPAESVTLRIEDKTIQFSKYGAEQAILFVENHHVIN